MRSLTMTSPRLMTSSMTSLTMMLLTTSPPGQKQEASQEPRWAMPGRRQKVLWLAMVYLGMDSRAFGRTWSVYRRCARGVCPWRGSGQGGGAGGGGALLCGTPGAARACQKWPRAGRVACSLALAWSNAQ